MLSEYHYSLYTLVYYQSCHKLAEAHPRLISFMFHPTAFIILSTKQSFSFHLFRLRRRSSVVLIVRVSQPLFLQEARPSRGPVNGRDWIWINGDAATSQPAADRVRVPMGGGDIRRAGFPCGAGIDDVAAGGEASHRGAGRL